MDKRKYPRYNVDIPIKIIPKNDTEKNEISAKINNVSEGGLKIVSSCDFNTNDLLTVKISIINVVLDLMAKVIRKQNAGSEKKYGVQFSLTSGYLNHLIRESLIKPATHHN